MSALVLDWSELNEVMLLGNDHTPNSQLHFLLEGDYFYT